MKNRLFRLLAGSGLATAANTLAALLATWWLPPDERGLMVLAVTVASFVPAAGTLGSGFALRSLLPQAGARKSRRLRAAYSTLSLAAVAVSSVVAGLLFLGYMAATNPGVSGLPALALVAGWSSGQQVVSRQLADAGFAAGEFQRTPLWSGTTAMLGVLAMAVVPAASRTAVSMLGAQQIALTLGSLAWLWWCCRQGFLARPGQGTRMHELIRLGLPVIPLSLGLMLMQRANRLIIAAHLGPAAVAVLTLASTATEVARLAATATGQLATHEFAQDGGGTASVLPLYRKAIALVVAVIALAFAGTLLLVVPVFGEAYAAVPHVILILGFGEIGFAVYLVSSMALLGAKQSKRAAMVATASGLVSVPVVYVGTAAGGMSGAALATTLAYTALGVLSALQLRRYQAGERRSVATGD